MARAFGTVGDLVIWRFCLPEAGALNEMTAGIQTVPMENVAAIEKSYKSA
jgi:hypothetical protein